MKKIIIAAVHPAPYIDIWIEALSSDFEVDSIYSFKKIEEKDWKKYIPISCKLYSDYNFFSLVKLLKKNEFVLFGGGWGIKKNILLRIALFPFRTKVAFFSDHPIISSTKTNLLARLLKVLIINSADYLFVASYSCLEYYSEIYKIKRSKLIIFPYMPSISKSKILEINNVRVENIKKGSKIRLFIANRFIPRKGYNILLDAFKKLDNEKILELFQIKIAGNGGEIDYYKKEFKELSSEIQFLEWIEKDEYENYMDECDVYIHTSIFEPFGIPPLDAMKRGKIIIVSDGVKSTDSFTNEKGVRIYPANNSTALYNELKRIIKEKNYLYESSINNFRLVNETYSPLLILSAVKKII